MSWKERICLGDLPARTQVEVTCKRCSKFYYVTIGQIQARHPVRAKYLDEFEECQICRVWGCGGECRVAIPPSGDTEGFQGGLA